MRVQLIPPLYASGATKTPLKVLQDCLSNPDMQVARFLTAFVYDNGLLRLIAEIEAFRNRGGQLQVVAGIDLHGTTCEALQRLLEVADQCWLFHNALPSHTFHPKAYLFEGTHEASLVIGSSNLTLGGLHNNYEVNILVDFDLTLPTDQAEYQNYRAQLWDSLFSHPTLCRRLTPELIEHLCNAGLLAKEFRAVVRERARSRTQHMVSIPFGTHAMLPPPPVAGAYLQRAARANNVRIISPQARRPVISIPPTVTTFVCMLSKVTEAPNNPGEIRLSKQALDVNPEFWQFPNRFQTHSAGRRGGKPGDFLEWYPTWRIEHTVTGEVEIAQVRIWLYPAKQEVRLYTSVLVEWGAVQHDIIVLEPATNGIDYLCRFVPQNSSEYTQWRSVCTVRMPHSMRYWGYL